MSFDGIVTNAVVKELENKIKGGRIDKIYQPEKDEIVISVHNKGENYRIVLSASSNNPRIYLTNVSKENPSSPPVFCMLLRKHLSGGIILNVDQYELDRVVFLDISSVDELGESVVKRLIIEVMGKHSNIILINQDNLKIIDSIKRVTENMSRLRQILPGITYESPPTKGKINPKNTNFTEFLSLLKNENMNTPICKALYFNYMGLSPLISKEICFLSNLDIDRTIYGLSDEDIESLYYSFSIIIKKINNNDFNPVYITTNNSMEILAFYCLDINQFGHNNKVFLDSISNILDIYYSTRDIHDRVSQKSHSIKKSIQVKLDRAKSKLAKQIEELIDSKDRDKYKIYADLISANLYRIPRGVDSISLDNFYDEDLSLLEVPLDIKLSPVENAQRYYKRYSKLKNANQLLLKQIPETEKEIEYLENVLLGIDNATNIREIEEIKEELIEEGYLKRNTKQTKIKKQKDSTPHHYLSSDGFHIYVGKNNKQNDYLTMKFANKNDLWLHVQNMPGSHVIIKLEGNNIPEATLNEAALLAAYFSRGKNGNHIPVDYSEKKNVRKPKNAKPGMVVYDKFKTIFVNPTLDLVQKITKLED
ncbi:MAG: fibronectin/fibrinogen-binding protein [Tissierellia bacterium]|nr:fibronectin/fibrinogen-binding protein [Tissierellia bacterium]